MSPTPFRRAVRLATIALSGLALSSCAPAPAPEYDLLLRGGTVVDGTGATPRVADVAVRGDRIAAIGALDDGTAVRTVDVTGLVLAPGFVDMHSHADLIALGSIETQRRLLGAKLRQGVTSLVVGNCGLGVAPSDDEAAAVLAAVNGWMTPDGTAAGALSIGGYLGRLEAGDLLLNVGTLVPHGPVRITAMGLASGEADVDALAAMRRAVGRGLDDGALGLSAGLIYPPGMYSDTDELAALAVEVAARDRLLTTHVRGSSQSLLRATEELIELGRRSGARVHHSHLEAVGEPYWSEIGTVLAMEDEARADGVELSHDVFLYTRAATMMSAIFPPWALEGGVPALLDRLRDADVRRRIGHEIETRVPEWPPWQPHGWPHNLVEAVGWDGIRVASVGSGGATDLVGRSLAEVAAERGGDPFELVSDLMLAEDGQVGQLVDEISGRGEEVDALLAIASHPAAAIVSDAEDYGRGSPHPAHAGAFARALRWSREGRLPPLPEVIRRMTHRPATLLGLDDRGVLRPGASADLVALDPERVADRATWEQPRRPADGVRWVVINGTIALADGSLEDVAPGKVLRR